MRVIFICKANAARSQMATALARSVFDESIAVECAGTEPGKFHPYAATVVEELSLLLPNPVPKSWQDLSFTTDDVIILLQENLRANLPQDLPARFIIWNVADPALPLTDSATCLARFRACRDDLHARIIALYGELCLARGHPKFWLHYKNKEYRVTGTCYHSETQERLVTYQTLYANDLSKDWVRPFTLFVSAIEFKGKLMARFKPCPLTITQLKGEDIALCMPLLQQLFPNKAIETIRTRLDAHPHATALAAIHNGHLFGFKLGYGTDAAYYSWLGGVDPNYRGLGIASDLMHAQHRIAQSFGYTRIRTKTSESWPDMLSLNIRHGFAIVGSDLTKAPIRLVMEKIL